MNIMPINNFNKNNAYNQNFKGAKEIKAAKKIIENFSEISAGLINLADPPGGYEIALTSLNVAMLTKISDLYKIKTDKQNAIKLVTEKLCTNKERIALL